MQRNENTSLEREGQLSRQAPAAPVICLPVLCLSHTRQFVDPAPQHARACCTDSRTVNLLVNVRANIAQVAPIVRIFELPDGLNISQRSPTPPRAPAQAERTSRRQTGCQERLLH